MLYGDLVQDDEGGYYVFPNDCDGIYKENKVDTDTIGQFTGLFDKSGKEICEGDIIQIDEEGYAKVVWNKEKASFEYQSCRYITVANTFYEFNMPYFLVVGNIHDNPGIIYEEKI